MADEKLIVEIDFDENKAKKSMKKVEANTKAALNRVAKTAVTVGAVIGSALAAKEFISAAIIQENAVNKLNTALKVTGQFSKDTSLDMQAFASELQSVTTFGDEAIIGQMGFALAMGASASQAKTITAAATNLAVAMDTDLNSAVRNVSKTLGGYAGELGEVIPELKNLTKEQMMSGAAIDLIAAKYEGFAAGEAKTFGGALTQLGNAWGDIFEKIGEIITQSPILIKAMNTSTKLIGDLLSKVDTTSLTASVSSFIFLVVDLGVALANLSQPFVTLWRVADVVFQNIKSLIQGIIAVIVRNISVIADLPFMDNILPTEQLQNLRASTKETFDGMIEDRNEAWATLTEGNTEFSDNLKLTAETFQSAMVTMVETTKTSLKEAGDGGDKQVKKMLYTSKQFGQAVGQLGSKVVTSAFDRLAKSLIKGENGFKGFFDNVLGMLGDFVQMMGQAVVATGIAMEAEKMFNGTGAIAAGLGLIALGSILKAMSGGDSAGAGTPAATSTTGSDSVGGTSIGQDLLSEDTTETQAEAGPRVTLNVQGDVLDSDETGTRLVSILNEAFEMKGETLITA